MSQNQNFSIYFGGDCLKWNIIYLRGVTVSLSLFCVKSPVSHLMIVFNIIYAVRTIVSRNKRFMKH